MKIDLEVERGVLEPHLVQFRIEKKIHFLEDRWVGEVPLKDSFRSLFSLAIDPKEFVVNTFDDGGNVWMLRLHRDLNEWELDEWYNLLSLLDGLKLDPNVVDSLV